MRMPDLALICSGGRTGTYWLTRALNKHPDILAAHSPVSPPLILDGGRGEFERTRTEVQNHRKIEGMTLDQIIEEMRSCGSQPYKCRVHAMVLSGAHDRLVSERCAGQITVLNVIRHPVTRTSSFAHHFSERLRHDFAIGTVAEMLELWRVDPTMAHYKRIVQDRWPAEDMTFLDNIFFLMAVVLQRREFAELSLPYPHYRFENLVRDREIFVAMLRDAFGEELSVTHEFIDAAFSTERLNGSRTEARASVGAAEIFARWRPWQKDVYRIFAEEHRLDEIYGSFGYDFSFLNADLSATG
jgi:hypothetical protein